MGTVVVKYQPKADMADENQALVEEVFAELAETDPGGLRYATYRLADGTFVHIADIADIEGEENPLGANQAFARFQEGIRGALRRRRRPKPAGRHAGRVLPSARTLKPSMPIGYRGPV